MDVDKPVPVVNIPSMRFIYGPTRQGIKGTIQGAWYTEKLVAVITIVGAPVEEDYDDIEIKDRKLVIHMECDGEAYWVRSLGEVWSTKSVNQWVDRLTNPS